MMRNKKPLAKAGRAIKQGASNNYPQDTLSSPLGQGEVNREKSAASHQPRLLANLHQSGIRLLSDYPIQFHTSTLCIFCGVKVNSGRGINIVICGGLR